MKGIWFLAPGEDAPAGFPLTLARVALAPGESLPVGDGEQAIYVLSGTVAVDGRTCPAGGAVIVEGAAAADVVAVEDAQVVRFGTRQPVGTGEAVHVVGPGGTWARVGDGRDTRYFADSECDTCAVTLFYTGRSDDYVSAPHRHSADELLHVVDGEVVVGRRRLGPGWTIAIAADQPYGFRSPGFGFLNYRAGPSTITRDGETTAEGGRVHGFTPVMDLR